MRRQLVCILCLFLVTVNLSCSTKSQKSEPSIEDEIAADSASESQVEDELDEPDDVAADEEIFADGGDDVADSEDSTPADDMALEGEVAATETEPEVEAETPTEPVTQPTPSVSAMVDVREMKYLANEGGGTFVIETSEPVDYRTRKNDTENQIVIEIANARLPDRLKRPYIMKDFNGPFGMANAYQDPGASTARIVLQLKSSGEPLVQQEGNSILIVGGSSGRRTEEVSLAEESTASEEESVEQKPTDSSSEPTSVATKSNDSDGKVLGAQSLNEFLTGNNRYYGKPISIQVKDTDIRDVINFIAEESGANIVLSDSVSGNITLKLRQIPWDQALVIIMKSRGLGYLRQGNVIRIATLEQLQKEAEIAQKVIETQRGLSPMRVKVIPISYAKPDDLVKQVDAFLTKGRGKVVADLRTSSLIITDTDEVLGQVSKLVKELDIPPTQILIEAKIVEASEEFTRSLGVDWSLSGGSIPLGTGADGSDVNLTPGIGISPLGRLAAETFGDFRLNIGTLDLLGNLSATLGLAEINRTAKVVSAPRIVTMNNEKAEISQTTQIPIRTTTVSEGVASSTNTFKDVRLNLTVTPQIASDGGVILSVEMLREFAGSRVANDVPDRPINGRKANTKVLVKNTQTAVIGGIYQSDTLDSETGVPWLKDIPILGYLFKSKTKDFTKNELMLFLTPRVLNAEDQTGARLSDSAIEL